jgi:protein-histidine pros-kinase
MRDCLQCHGSLSAAPKSMLDLYGSANGFGWKLGDVIGAQIVSIPMSVPIEEANHAWLQLLLFLIGVMIVAILALDAAVYWFVIRPLKLVSETADRVSRGEKDVNPVRVTSKDEIATVASSFNRMQVSLAKALKMVEED